MGRWEIADTVGGCGEYGARYQGRDFAERMGKNSKEYEENRNSFQPPILLSRIIVYAMVLLGLLGFTIALLISRLIFVELKDSNDRGFHLILQCLLTVSFMYFVT